MIVKIRMDMEMEMVIRIEMNREMKTENPMEMRMKTRIKSAEILTCLMIISFKTNLFLLLRIFYEKYRIVNSTSRSERNSTKSKETQRIPNKQSWSKNLNFLIKPVANSKISIRLQSNRPLRVSIFNRLKHWN